MSVKNSWIDKHIGKVSSVALLSAMIFAASVVEIPTLEPEEPVAKVEQAKPLQSLKTADAPEAVLPLDEIGLEESPEWVAEQQRLKEEAEAKAAKEAAEAEAKAKQRRSPTSQSSSASAPIYTGGGSKEEWLKASGIAESDWGYVDYIVNRESSWNPNAVNASSGASGLVQALPCGKVPGSCLNPVDNLRWADGYAKDRYGSWAQAYSFWTANHWW